MSISTQVKMAAMSDEWEIKYREDRLKTLDCLIEKSVAEAIRCKDDFSPESASIYKTIRERLKEIDDLENELDPSGWAQRTNAEKMKLYYKGDKNEK